MNSRAGLERRIGRVLEAIEQRVEQERLGIILYEPIAQGRSLEQQPDVQAQLAHLREQGLPVIVMLPKKRVEAAYQ